MQNMPTEQYITALEAINEKLLSALVECVAVPNKHRPEYVWDNARSAIFEAGKLKRSN